MRPVRSMRAPLLVRRVRTRGGKRPMNFFGYAGTVLKIDLTEKRVSKAVLREDELKKFVGGFGLNCKIATDILKPKTDPFSLNNPIVIGAGPLVGTVMPGASRLVGLTKFPASGAIANSCGSMSFGFHMKQAGYDHIIVTGKAETPTYLTFFDERVEFCAAETLWGRDIVDTTDALQKQHGLCGVIAIGQAGENLVKSALTLIDKTSTFGRGGLGAVMGAKNLKAVVAKGTKGVPIADPKKFFALYETLFKRIRDYPEREDWHKVGMLRNLPVGMLLSARGEKEKVKQVSERIYLRKLKKRRIACPSCPMGDKEILELKEGPFCGLINYNSSVINPFLLFTAKNLKTYDEAVKIFDLINRYGLDSLTITAQANFLDDLYERKIITDNDIGFPWRRDYETLARLVVTVAQRKGFGQLLSEGWNALASAYGVEKEAPSIKGLDVVFEPRILRLGTMEFEQVVNPKGAHVASGGSPTYAAAGKPLDQFTTHFRRMGIPDPAIARVFEPPKKGMGLNIGRLTRYSEDWYTVLSSLGLCARAQMNRFFSLELVTQFYNAATGFELSPSELMLAAERSWNLLKLMNVKEGFSRKDDAFPEVWFSPLRAGDNELAFKDFYGEEPITRELANQLLDDYYDERGWDIKGLPKKSKLEELGL